MHTLVLYDGLGIPFKLVGAEVLEGRSSDDFFQGGIGHGQDGFGVDGERRRAWRSVWAGHGAEWAAEQGIAQQELFRG